MGIKFCFELDRTTEENYGTLELISGKRTMNGTETFECFFFFKVYKWNYFC